MHLKSGTIYTIDQPMYKKTVIIIDLDHTLVHSVHDYDYQDADYPDPDFHLCQNDYKCFERPHINQLLDYCFKESDHQIIWSAGTKDYVEEIITKMKNNKQFTMVLSRDYCSNKRIKDFSKIKRLLSDHAINTDNSLFIWLDDLPDRIANFNKPNNQIIAVQPYFKRKRDNDDSLDEELSHCVKKVKVSIDYLSTVWHDDLPGVL
jgi:hypothetical protein